MPKEHTIKKQMQFMNSIAKAAVNEKIIPQEIYNQYKLTSEQSEKIQNKNYSNLYKEITLADQNFIMNNFLNMIRYQTYLDLKGEALSDSKYGFWKTGKGNGELIMTEDLLEATERTGDMIADAGKISNQPEVEEVILLYSEMKAADMPRNPDLEKWATLEGSTEWINERLSNLKSALDFPISNYLKEQINDYAGLTNILIDDTFLITEPLKAKALQKAIGTVILEITNDYRNFYNEELTLDAEDNFTYRINRKDIGLIFDTSAEINNEIEYLRRLRKSFDGNSNNYDKDWGVGEIINQDLPEGEEVKLIPKQKFKWGAQFGSGETSLGYALHRLITEYVFYGSQWLKAAPGLTFSFGTLPEGEALEIEIKAPLEETKNPTILKLKQKIKNQIDWMESAIEKFKNMPEPAGVIGWKSKVGNATRQLKEEIKRINDEKFLRKRISTYKVFKGNEILGLPSESKETEDKTLLKVATAFGLKIEDLEEQIKNIEGTSSDKEIDIEKDAAEEVKGEIINTSAEEVKKDLKK